MHYFSLGPEAADVLSTYLPSRAQPRCSGSSAASSSPFAFALAIDYARSRVLFLRKWFKHIELSEQRHGSFPSRVSGPLPCLMSTPTVHIIIFAICLAYRRSMDLVTLTRGFATLRSQTSNKDGGIQLPRGPRLALELFCTFLPWDSSWSVIVHSVPDPIMGSCRWETLVWMAVLHIDVSRLIDEIAKS
jgi:hypothetical protein